MWLNANSAQRPSFTQLIIYFFIFLWNEVYELLQINWNNVSFKAKEKIYWKLNV